ncbi:hypothetical protein FXO38_22383 [Capsicum annuum]|nr:hypothetical protein FXO38_22383 [Capsicum annuum]
MSKLRFNVQVRDIGLILDMMAVMLENITSIQVVARTTIAAVYRIPRGFISSVTPCYGPPDHETCVGAHRIFSFVLVPSSVSPQKVSKETRLRKAADFSRALSRTVSVFSSSAALFGKLRD